MLTEPGLSTIVTAIVTSRKIFQRMKNFVIYRIACTEQLLFFFFMSCIFYHPNEFNDDWPSYFYIPSSRSSIDHHPQRRNHHLGGVR